MGEKRKSYRDRYFENYQGVKVPASNKKGYRIVYQYTGLFVKWKSETRTLARVKWTMLLTEIASLAIYLPAALSGVPMSLTRLFNGFGVLSIVPWAEELLGLIRFLLSKEYVKETSAEEIGRNICIGCVLHAILTTLSLIFGSEELIISGKASVRDILVGLATAISIILSLLIWRQYTHLKVDKYHNDNGSPGIPA